MITFETKCYEKDWRLILTTPYLERQIEKCNRNFDFRHLIINNVENETTVRKFADKAVAKNIIDSYFLVSEYKNMVLDFFQIPENSFNGGYYYSISELTGIYCCKTDYLLHFAGDSRIERNNSNWINDAMELMKHRHDISIANPVWNFKYSEAKNESTEEDSQWFYSQGFSDQCYLIKTEEFRQPVYNYRHPDSDRYPKYGGELFEKRVDSYLRCLNKSRITAKNVSYIHQNIPKNRIKRFFQIMKWKLQ